MLVLLGLLFYTTTQGARFLALQYITAPTVSLILNFTPVAVGLMSVPLLGERTTARQWAVLAVVIGGVGIMMAGRSRTPSGQYSVGVQTGTRCGRRWG